MQEPIESFTIYHSPNAYLGVTLVRRRFAALGARVVRRPIAIPKERGVKVADLVGGREPARKSSYHREDCARWAAQHGVEIRFLEPAVFEERARRWASSPYDREELPARAYYAAEALDAAAAERLDEALFRAAWVDGLDVNEEEVVRGTARAAGLDPDDLLRRALTGEPRRRLEESIAAFDRAGCPGVPTWVFDGERFWGKDRINALATRVSEKLTSSTAGGGPRIRPLCDRDVESVVALWQTSFPDDPPRNEPRAIIRRKRAAQPDLLLVADLDGEVVGAVLVGWEGHRGWIEHLAVAPALRRRGIGRALVEASERRLRALGCPKVNLQVRESNAGVIAFYERLGFAVEPRVSLGKIL